MKNLNNIFSQIAYKKIALGECDHEVSNQHEFNGVSTLKAFFGCERKSFNCKFILMSEQEGIIEDTVQLTWYDARENHDTRSEYRLYYARNQIMPKVCEGDLLLFLMYRDHVFAIVCESGSSYENQIMHMFDIHNHDMNSQKFNVANDFHGEIDFTRRRILEEIGIEENFFARSDANLEKILAKFGLVFPSTKEFSEFARSCSGDTFFDDLNNNMDECLMGWIEKEEELFYSLEKYLVEQKLKEGFSDVNDFIKYSLSVQNRRKARIGHSLENHLEEIFKRNNINYSRGAITENKSRPDFIFPGIKQYQDSQYPAVNLRMLGVKSTCKDRWRQILSEAARIKNKHLFTLEASISSNQTNEMKAHKTQLVIPKSIHNTYSSEQKKDLLTLNKFISMVKKNCIC